MPNSFLDSDGVEHLAADIKALADNTYVNIDGDKMTDDLQIESPSINIGQTPSSDIYQNGLELVDVNGNLIGQFQAVSRSNGEIGAWYGASRNVGGSQIDNKVRMTVDGSGNTAVTVSQPGNWRDALALNPVAVSGLTAGSSDVNLGSNCYAWTIGNLCMVTLNIQITANISSGSTLVKGLPKNSSKQVSFAAAKGGTTYSAAMRIQGNATTITNDGAISQTGWYNAFFMYVMA